MDIVFPSRLVSGVVCLLILINAIKILMHYFCPVMYVSIKAYYSEHFSYAIVCIEHDICLHQIDMDNVFDRLQSLHIPWVNVNEHIIVRRKSKELSKQIPCVLYYMDLPEESDSCNERTLFSLILLYRFTFE